MIQFLYMDKKIQLQIKLNNKYKSNGVPIVIIWCVIIRKIKIIRYKYIESWLEYYIHNNLLYYWFDSFILMNVN
jgi:hypothetical protein